MVRESIINLDFFVGSEYTSEEDLNITVNHFHHVYEIYYLEKGSVTYFADNSVYAVEKGEFILIRPNVIHTTKYGESDHKRILIYFKESFIKEFLSIESDMISIFDNVHLRLAKTNEKRAEEIMKHILFEYRSDNSSTVLLKCLLGELLKLFAENHSESLEPRIPDGENTIFSIISYINSNYQNPLTLNNLSRIFYLNPAYLSRSFKASTGMGFKDYLTQVRLREASILLKNSDLSISEIYERTGFSSINHFCKTFKSAFGVTALKFRKYT